MCALHQLRCTVGVGRFIERGLLESDAVRVEPTRTELLRSECRDRGRVDTSAQKCPDGYVGHEPALDRAAEERAQLLAPALLGIVGYRIQGFEHEVPVLPDAQRAGRQIVLEAVPAGQLPYALDDAVRRRNVTVREE